MIIRRKKTTTALPQSESNILDNLLEKDFDVAGLQQPVVEEEKEEVQIFDVDNFDFLQRDERRRGDRRRGYRRIDDRNLVSRAQMEATSIKETAIKDGYNKGLEQAQADIEELRESLREFFSYKEKVAKDIARDVLEIALDVAQTIIKKEVEQDKEILLNTVVDILKSNVKSDERVTLKVSPEDVEFVRMSIPDMLSIAQTEAKISVIAQDNIEKGSVIVETSSGVVDASFKTQLDVLREAFKGI